jgi:hypothetical protein
VLRATSDHAEVGDGPRPQLLANGDILVPITDDGRTRMVRLEPGEEEHAEWFGYIQTGRW